MDVEHLADELVEKRKQLVTGVSWAVFFTNLVLVLPLTDMQDDAKDSWWRLFPW